MRFVLGCGSATFFDPNLGTLYQIDSEAELQRFEANKAFEQISAVLSPSLFTRATIDRLIATKRVGSVLVKSDAGVKPSRYALLCFARLE